MTNPELHPEFLNVKCGLCLNHPIPTNYSIPVLVTDDGRHLPLCGACAVAEIQEKHPLSAEYMYWVTDDGADPRWWSVWMCNHCLDFDVAPELLIKEE